VYSSTYTSHYVGSINQAGDVHVGRYNTSGAVWDVFRLKKAMEVDEHDTPAVLVLHASGSNPGKVLACYSQHNGSSFSRVSTTAGDVTAWGTEVAVSSGNSDAYVHLAQTQDTAYTTWWFFRRGAANPRPHYYRTSTDGGATWNAAVSLFSVASQRPYFQVYQNGANRIDFLCTDGQPSETTNNIYHFYMTVASGGTFTLSKSDGTQIGNYNANGTTITGTALPLAAANVTTVWSGGNSWCWDLCSVGGTLTAAFTVFSTVSTTDDVHRYYRATLSGGTWSTEAITYAGATVAEGAANGSGTGGSFIPQTIYPAAGAEREYSPGICLDPNTVDRVYLARKWSETSAGGTVSDIRLEQWDKVSGSWGKTTDISGNTSSMNVRPMWIRNAPSTQLVYWSSTGGSYSAYTTYYTRLQTYPVIAQYGLARDDFVETSAINIAVATHRPEEGGKWLSSSAFQHLATPATPNRIRPTNTSTQAMYLDVTPSTADYWAQAVVNRVTAVGTSTAGVCVRMDAAATTHYHFRYEDTLNGFRLYRFVSGSATQLGSDYTAVGITAGSSRTLKLEAVGSNPVVLTASVDGVTAVSFSDSNAARITATGAPGLRCLAGGTPSDSTGLQFASYLAGETIPATPTAATAAITLGSVTVAGAATASAAPSSAATAAITLGNVSIAGAATAGAAGSTAGVMHLTLSTITVAGAGVPLVPGTTGAAASITLGTASVAGAAQALGATAVIGTADISLDPVIIVGTGTTVGGSAVLSPGREITVQIDADAFGSQGVTVQL